jgi:PAS domain S-box-containing protein
VTHSSDTLNAATAYPASLFFDNNPLPCFIVNAASLQIINANRICCKFYGYTAPELTALSFLDLDCSTDKLKLFQNFPRPSIDQVCKVGRQHLKKNGDIVAVEIYTSVLKIESKTVYQIAVVDVTETKESKKITQI